MPTLGKFAKSTDFGLLGISGITKPKPEGLNEYAACSPLVGMSVCTALGMQGHFWYHTVGGRGFLHLIPECVLCLGPETLLTEPSTGLWLAENEGMDL